MANTHSGPIVVRCFAVVIVELKALAIPEG